MARTIRIATRACVQERLRRFEELYAMPSVDFLRRWQEGVLDDRADYFKWTGICHLAVELGLLPSSCHEAARLQKGGEGKDRDSMPSRSPKQQRLMGADLARARAGKATQTGLSEAKLEEMARKPKGGYGKQKGTGK